MRGMTGVTVRAAAAVAASAFGAMIVTSAAAQTLIDPNSAIRPPAPPPRPTHTKPQPDRQAKSCSAFGPGFVNVPGTDACIKIGGWVSIEGSR